MPRTATSINVDTKVKAEAQALFNELGLDFSTAVGLFLRQAIRERRIPFEIRADVPEAERNAQETRGERRLRYLMKKAKEPELTTRTVEEIDKYIREMRNNDRN